MLNNCSLSIYLTLQLYKLFWINCSYTLICNIINCLHLIDLDQHQQLNIKLNRLIICNCTLLNWILLIFCEKHFIKFLFNFGLFIFSGWMNTSLHHIFLSTSTMRLIFFIISRTNIKNKILLLSNYNSIESTVVKVVKTD